MQIYTKTRFNPNFSRKKSRKRGFSPFLKDILTDTILLIYSSPGSSKMEKLTEP